MLYEDGAFNFLHKSKIISTSQYFPNLQIDSGSKRRIVAYPHKSIFVENPKDVDESKHIYLKNKDLLDQIMADPDKLNAWVDILVEYASNYINGEKVKYSSNFESAKEEILASNDYIQDFIDSRLIKTDKPTDKIGKREMYDIFHDMYPNKHLKELDIISALKEKRIIYDKGVRGRDSVRGCFIGVRLRNDKDGDNEENKERHEALLSTNTEVKLEKATKRIAELESIVEQLKSQLDQQKVKKVTTKININKLRELNDQLDVENEQLDKEAKKITKVLDNLLTKQKKPPKMKVYKTKKDIIPLDTPDEEKDKISKFNRI
jgi:hypothetical protein